MEPARASSTGGPRGWCLRHPLLVVALIAGVGALASGWVIWHQRVLGTYDPDEAGYLASALRYQRSIQPSSPTALLDEVAATSLGPLVPLLSVITLILGPRDPRSAMLVQPLLLVVTAVAAAGITRRLTGPVPTIVAGALVAGVPTMVLASRSYWLGLGAAATLALAVWALLASSRLTNRWRWAYGAALGAMLLSRTMMLGLLPGLLAAGAFLAHGDRRRWRGLAEAAAVAAMVAGPWWFVRRREIFDYLLGYGYGDDASRFGSGGPVERLGGRALDVAEGMVLRGPWVGRLTGAAPGAVGLVLAGLLVWAVVATVRSATLRPLRSNARDPALALGVVVVCGTLALASTSNQGVWFELPLVVVAVPLVVAVAARAPLLPRLALLGWMAFVAMAAPVTLTRAHEGHADGARRLYDARFGDPRVAEQVDAAAEWWALDRAVTAELGRLTGRGSAGTVTITGNTFLFNSNSIELAAELDGWTMRAEVPDTTSPPAARARSLSARSDSTTDEGEAKERILVVVDQPRRPFTPDARWRTFARQADRLGWEPVARFELPVPGTVVVLRHVPR